MPVPVWCEYVFNGVGKFGDTRLFDYARGTLQRVRKPEDAPYEILSTLPSF
jgi:hypothetical protein